MLKRTKNKYSLKMDVNYAMRKKPKFQTLKYDNFIAVHLETKK